MVQRYKVQGTNGTKVQRFKVQMVQGTNGIMVQWYKVQMVQWYNGTRYKWYNGTMVQGSMVQCFKVQGSMGSQNLVYYKNLVVTNHCTMHHVPFAPFAPCTLPPFAPCTLHLCPRARYQKLSYLCNRK